MTRDEALAEILRRAHREHGTCVLTLRRLERELADLRRYVECHTGSPGDRAHAGYLVGVANIVELVEEALFEAFRVQPTELGPSLSDQLPALDGLPPAWWPRQPDPL